MSTDDSPSALDVATRRATTRRTFDELVSGLRRGGYVYLPVLREAAHLEREHRDAILLLRRELHARGLEISPAWGAHPDERSGDRP